MTVEEILVKFTGDASSFVNASEKSKLKTKDFSDEMLKLDRVLTKAKVGTAGYEMSLAKLEKTTIKYSETLDKLKKQESRSGGGGSGLFGGGFGGGGGGRLGIGGAFAAGAGVSAITGLGGSLHDTGRGLFSQFEKEMQVQLNGFSGRDNIKSIAESQRNQAEEDDRASYLASRRGRRIQDQERAVGRESSGRDHNSQLELQTSLQKDLQKQLDESKKSQEFYKKTVEATDSAFHILRPTMKTTFDEASKSLKEEVAHMKQLESATHAATEKIKDMKAQQWQAVQQQKQRTQDLGKSFLSQTLLLNNPNMTGIDLQMMDERERVKKEIDANNPNESPANKAKLLAAALEELEIKYRNLKIAEKDAFEMDFLKGQEQKVRAFGKTAAEAFLLQQKAIGKEVDPERAAGILATENKLRGLEVTEQFQTPYEKAMKEKEKLDAIRGELSPETYQRAMAEIDKGMRGPGPAASRSATGYGSAEHSARMYAYGQVMTQPATQKANIDRLANEPGKTTDKQSEANNYLRSIRDSIKGKKTVEVQPANLGGG